MTDSRNREQTNEGAINACEQDGALLLDILVAPRASRAKVGPPVGGRLKVAITAPPVDGKANAAVVALLARAFGARRADVTIVSGDRGKRKRVRIDGATLADLAELAGPEAVR